uniref:Uncharacterized protein n=1 Tax=Lygus hesperus TaxID=30085 RepID=A0A0A9YZ50_LYGHE
MTAATTPALAPTWNNSSNNLFGGGGSGGATGFAGFTGGISNTNTTAAVAAAANFSSGTNMTTMSVTSGSNWRDYNKQSALVNYLFEFDKAYDALHSSCRFRGFVQNCCPPGQAESAIQKDRYTAFLHSCTTSFTDKLDNNNTSAIVHGSGADLSCSKIEGTGATT